MVLEFLQSFAVVGPEDAFVVDVVALAGTDVGVVAAIVAVEAANWVGSVNTAGFVLAVVINRSEDVVEAVELVVQEQPHPSWSQPDLVLEAGLICWSSHWRLEGSRRLQLWANFFAFH